MDLNRYYVTYVIKRNGREHFFHTYAWARTAEAVREEFKRTNERNRENGRPHMFRVTVRLAPAESRVDALGGVLGKALLPRL